MRSIAGPTDVRERAASPDSPDRLEADYLAAAHLGTSRKRMPEVQRDRMWQVCRLLVKRGVPEPWMLASHAAQELAERHQDDGFAGLYVHTTWPQLAKALGLSVDGLNVRQIAARYTSRMRQTMRYLRTAGRIAGWDVIYEGREPIGILLRVPAGVAQSVRATMFRRPSSAATRRVAARREIHDRVFFPDHVGLHSGTFKEVGLSLPSEIRDGGGARACARELGTRDRAHLSTSVRVALTGCCRECGEETGRQTLARLPWLADVDPDILAREAARVHRPTLNLAISRYWQDRLEVAARQIARWGWCGRRGPAAAAELVLDLARSEDLEELLNPRAAKRPQPRSLGAVAVALRRLARDCKRTAHAGRPTAAAASLRQPHGGSGG